MTPQLTQQRADEILRTASERNVVVYGDVMLDEFVWGDVTRISPEAPVPVVDVRRESVHLGGAANVLANLVSLGAGGSVVGVVGSDAAGERLKTGLRELGTQDQYLIVDETLLRLQRLASLRTASWSCVPIASRG